MKTIFKIFLALAILSGCKGERERTARDIVKNLVYVRDESTGVCFAYFYEILTYVPCEKVEHKLIPSKQAPAKESHYDGIRTDGGL